MIALSSEIKRMIIDTTEKTIRFIIIWFFKKTFGELDSRLNKKHVNPYKIYKSNPTKLCNSTHLKGRLMFGTPPSLKR